MVQSTFLKLPEKTLTEQKRSKIAWNIRHAAVEPDFYTIGYSGKDISEFLAILETAGISTLVDIRYSPVSRFKPEFSKNNLKNALEADGIAYIHRQDWGIPREIRAYGIGKKTREDLWAWYDQNVLPQIIDGNLDEFFNAMEHPAVFMCSEYDPTECHRHRLFLGLERLGLRGRDL